MNKIKPLKQKLTLVFGSLFFPFTIPEIFEALKKREYIIAPLNQPIPMGQRIYVEGRIGMKNNCVVEISDSRKSIGIEGESIEKILETTKEIIQISADDFNTTVQDIDYAEFISDILIISQDDPIQTIQNFDSGYELFNEIFDIDVAPYSIKIVPKNTNPSSKNWFDILLEPRILKPNSEYFVHIIYRNENLENVMEFTNKSDLKILSIVKLIGDQIAKS